MKCQAQVCTSTTSYHDCGRAGARPYVNDEGTRIQFCKRHVSRAESHGMKLAEAITQ
jgi:hypothetical protein